MFSRTPSNGRLKASARQVTVLLLCLGLMAYFAGHAMQGRHGLEARQRLQAREATLSSELDALEAVRSRLERDVALIGRDPPDADMLDEQARRVLGFARPGERLLVEAR